MNKQTFALYFANRGFSPETLVPAAYEEMTAAVKAAGYDYIALTTDDTKLGAVACAEDGYVFANFLKANAGKFDGIIICMPNFGDENGAVAACRDAGVPILIQAYPDVIGEMDFDHRRDSFCGKISIENLFGQCNIPFSAYKPHTVHPSSEAFRRNLDQFASVCRIVKRMRKFTIGALGARTTPFKTVRYDEYTLQKHGITVETFDLSELFAAMRALSSECSSVKDKKEILKAYCDFSKVPEDKFDSMARMSVCIDRMIENYHFDAVSMRCWNEIHQEFGIAPCVLLSEFNDRGIAFSCELDVANAVTMVALQEAAEMPATCLDWNNNYGDDPDKCIVFHCGPVPQKLMTSKGTVGIHKMFAKGKGNDYGWGVNEGRIAPMPMTYSSASTIDGKFRVYVGEGEITDDPIESTFFGCGGVAKIADLQDKLIYIGKNGFKHHTTLTGGHVADAVQDAMETYLGYDVIRL